MCDAEFPTALKFGIVHQKKYFGEDDPNTDTLHIHQYLEIFFNASTEVSFFVNNTLYPVVNGNAVVVFPGDIHVCLFDEPCTHEHICLWIDADMRLPIFSFLMSDNYSPLFSFDSETAKKMKSLLLSLAKLCENGGTSLEKNACLLQILLLFEGHSHSAEKKLDVPETLQNILDDINNNFATIGNVNDILRAHFISSATLTRWFRKYIHTSPREYLESVRLSNAVTMLANGASVTDACMGSGFSDCSRFIILFKDKFGETPLQYKKRARR